MSKTNILLIYDSVEYFIPCFKSKGIKVFPSFKPVSTIEKLFRKISFRFNVCLSFWYNDWKGELSGTDIVIVFATKRIDHLTYIKKKYPEIRIILWYWNPVYRCFNPNNLPKELCEVWSFDNEDCEKFNLQYNSTFYFDNIKLKSDEIKYDLLFVGYNKGRGSEIDKLKCMLGKRNVETYFYVVPDNKAKQNVSLKPLPYKKYLAYLVESKAILDFVQNGQSGLTLRVMESLFFQKKLVTNNRSIVHEDFYEKENVFILDYDNIDTIQDFLCSPFKPINQKILKQYDVCKWIDRFNLK